MLREGLEGIYTDCVACVVAPQVDNARAANNVAGDEKAKRNVLISERCNVWERTIGGLGPST